MLIFHCFFLFKYIYYSVNIEIFNIILIEPWLSICQHSLSFGLSLKWNVWYGLMLEYFEWRLQKLTQTSFIRNRKFMTRRSVVSECKRKNKRHYFLISHIWERIFYRPRVARWHLSNHLWLRVVITE